jgi:nucleoside-diphosphate-sugar epimerase
MATILNPKILIVGCGDLGSVVASQINVLGMQAIGVRRHAQEIEGVTIIQADVTEPSTLVPLTSLQPEVLIYCVAASAQTDDSYKVAYVDGLRHVLATQVGNKHLKHVFFVSSTRVYGQVTADLLSESTLPMPADFGGERLLEAESLLSALSCKATALRLSGIYGPGRLHMIKLAQSPARWSQHDSWSNRIHRDDAASFIVYLVKQALSASPLLPCYIVTDSKPVSQYEVLNWIANKLHIDVQLPFSDVEGGKRLSNQAMMETGFKLQYPDYQAGYQALLLESNPT